MFLHLGRWLLWLTLLRVDVKLLFGRCHWLVRDLSVLLLKTAFVFHLLLEVLDLPGLGLPQHLLALSVLEGELLVLIAKHVVAAGKLLARQS